MIAVLFDLNLNCVLDYMLGKLFLSWINFNTPGDRKRNYMFYS